MEKLFWILKQISKWLLMCHFAVFWSKVVLRVYLNLENNVENARKRKSI